MGTKIIAVIYSTYAVAKRKPEKKKINNAPCLSSGLSLSLTLVSSRRKVVIGFCATRIL